MVLSVFLSSSLFHIFVMHNILFVKLVHLKMRYLNCLVIIWFFWQECWIIDRVWLYIFACLSKNTMLSTNYVRFSWFSLSSMRSPKNARKQKTKLLGVWEGRWKQMEVRADAALVIVLELTFSHYLVSTLICLISRCWIFAMLLLCWILVGWNVCIYQTNNA